MHDMYHKYPFSKLKVTGHSLGGALAQLTAMSLIKDGYHVDQMINFGAPRVGDSTYATFSEQKMPNQWRMVHNRDIVPHLPFAFWPMNFNHTSTEVF